MIRSFSTLCIWGKRAGLFSCARNAAIFFIFLICAPNQTIAKEVYVNGIDPGYPPFSFIDEHGKPSGFDVESMNWIANAMGFTVEHRPINWDGALPALLMKKVDMICSGMSVTPERSKVVLFTKPYWETKKILIARKDSPLTLEDFYSKKIRLGAQRGANEAEKLKREARQKQRAYELRLYESTALAIEDLLNGRIDAVVLDRAIADDALRHGKPFKTIGVIEEGELFAVALRKDEIDLAKRIDEGYERLKKDPFWQTLQKKYLEQPPTPNPL